MFPFTSCVSILRRHERPTDWHQINGTLTFSILAPNNNHGRSSGSGSNKGASYDNSGKSGGGSLQALENSDEKRRGAISFERTDKNAIYIRMLGDVKMRSSPEKPDTGQSDILSDGDRKMIDKVSQPEHRPRLRSRFLSLSKSRRPHRRRAHAKLSPEGRLMLDDFYSEPARLLLADVGRWDFNIFTLDTLSGGRSLFHVAYHLFQSYDFIRSFRLDSVRLLHFFSLVEENYHDSNPYHNALHAADVTQSMHCYLQEREVKTATTDVEKMVALVAALTHDLDHPGVNNAFLIVTSNHLASLYQNSSVLENHHWRCAVGLLHETGLLDHWSQQQRLGFYAQLKTLILATDITRQQEFLLKFSRYIESGEFQYSRNDEHRLFMLQIALKCADISNPCRPWKVSQRWSRRVCHEFFLQGDTERNLHVPVTPLCDRFGNTIANIQHGFMNFVVQPLFKAWDQFLSTRLSSSMMRNLAANQGSWKAVMDGKGSLAAFRSLKTRAAAGGAGDSVIMVADDDATGSDSSDSEAGYEEFVVEGDGIVKHEIMDSSDIIDEGEEETQVRNRGGDEVDEVMGDKENEASSGSKVVTLVLPQQEEVEEADDESRSEEADVVANDVNLAYHYPNDIDENVSVGIGGVAGPRCLSPVSEGGELNSSGNAQSLNAFYQPGVGGSNNNNLRRFSVPALTSVRKDLSFYLGLRRESAGPSPSSSTNSFASSSTPSCSYNVLSRRQSLPTTAMYFHGASKASTNVSPDLSTVSPRSLSVDALLTRPKITTLSPGGFGEMGSFPGGFPASASGSTSNLDAGASTLTPSQSDQAVATSGTGQSQAAGGGGLYNQTLLLLQGSDLTRFTSNPTGRRASYEPGLAEHTRLGTREGCEAGRRLTLPHVHTHQRGVEQQDYASTIDTKGGERTTNRYEQKSQSELQSLAASWPSLASKRRTTNGTTSPHKQNHVIDNNNPSFNPSLLENQPSKSPSDIATNPPPKMQHSFIPSFQLNNMDYHAHIESSSPPSLSTLHQQSPFNASQSGISDPMDGDGADTHLPPEPPHESMMDTQRTSNVPCLSLVSSSLSTAQESEYQSRPQ